MSSFSLLNTMVAGVSLRHIIFPLALEGGFLRVWENNLKSMVEDGYERPSLTEGFEDFTYIVS